MPDLRSAVVWLTSTVDAPWTAQELAGLGDAPLDRARAYAARLVRLGVLRLVSWQGAPAYLAGVQARSWRHYVPKTRPGGNSKDEAARRAIREDLRARAWQEGRAGKDHKAPPPPSPLHTAIAVLTCQGMTEGDTAGLPPSGAATVDSPPSGRSLAEAASLLGVSTRTLQREISKGRLQAFRVGDRGLRITPDELLAYQQRNVVGGQRPLGGAR